MIRLVFSLPLLLVCGGAEAPRSARVQGIGEWGAPSNGLAARLATDSSVVPMGACIEFQILFRFEQGEAGVNLLNVLSPSWTAHFEFRNLVTGQLFDRTRYYESGPPDLQQPEPVSLAEESIRPLPVAVCLLHEDGEQIPAGTYAVVGALSNLGGGGRLRIHDPAYSPDAFWTGEVRTGEFRVRVLHAEPRDVEFELPAQIRVWFDEGERRLVWSYGARFWTFWKKTRAKVRPGYLVGYRVGVSHRSPGRPESSLTSPPRSQSWGFGDLPKRSDFPTGAFHLSGAAFADATPEHPIEVVVALLVFESPKQDEHLWIPREGEYTVLAADTLRASWP